MNGMRAAPISAHAISPLHSKRFAYRGDVLDQRYRSRFETPIVESVKEEDVESAIADIPATRRIKLLASDGETVEVEDEAIFKSALLKSLIESTCDLSGNLSEESVTIPVVSGNILRKVFEYCSHHVNSTRDPESLDTALSRFNLDPPMPSKHSSQALSKLWSMNPWDEAFVQRNWSHLMAILNAAHYLDVKDLVELLCRSIAQVLAPMTAEQIREFTGVENDYTPEEEEKVRLSYPWIHHPHHSKAPGESQMVSARTLDGEAGHMEHKETEGHSRARPLTGNRMRKVSSKLFRKSSDAHLFQSESSREPL